MQQLRHGLTIESNLYESSADDVDHLDALDAQETEFCKILN